jgi:hypothetical protein
MLFLIFCYFLWIIYSQEDPCVGKSEGNCVGDCYFLPFNGNFSVGKGGLCTTDLCIAYLTEAKRDLPQIPFVNIDKQICEFLEFCEVFFFLVIDFFFFVVY